MKTAKPAPRRAVKKTQTQKRDRLGQIQDTFAKMGLATHQDRMRFIQFADASPDNSAVQYITYISGESCLSSSV